MKNYIDYQKASKKLFKQVFGNDVYKKLNTATMVGIDWKGIDIDECYEICACSPNIKERFTQDELDYFKDRGYTLLDIYIQSVFHYGYTQKFNDCKEKEKEKDILYDKSLMSVINILSDENEKLKKEISILTSTKK